MWLNSASELIENHQIIGARENTKWGTQCFSSEDLKRYSHAGHLCKNTLLKLLAIKVLML